MSLPLQLYMVHDCVTILVFLSEQLGIFQSSIIYITSNMRTILIVLLTLLFHWQVEGTGLSNFNLVKVENKSWTNDYQRTQSDRGPV